MSIVTDFSWYDPRKKHVREGYYMDYFLARNLLGIPKYLAAAWDVVGIVSGHGKVRIGKSTLAQQVGYFCAWMMAGGVMGEDERKGKLFVKKKPTKEVRFAMENLVFTPDDLMKRADELYKKYGKHQVIIYDEGRSGLDSARAMESVNKIMQDFFQECGFMGHIILIVLPNFFKLHEDYAVNRSLFLLDVYANQNLKRGYFSFYNEINKEFLYFNGKKKLGSTLKYYGSNVSFKGRFTPFSTLNKTEYEAAKRAGLKKKQLKTKEVVWKRQRDAALYLLRRASAWELDAISKEMTAISGHYVSAEAVRHAIQNITHQKVEDQA
ncbi:MAG: hypothetical protein ACHQ1D_00880 [Nitrososphaerales archaeon]